MENYDILSADSIIEYAKKLKGQTLRYACGDEIIEHGYKGKGNFGQILEKYYFGYEPNSDTDPDFKEAGLELKTSPLKILKNGEYRSKERLVLNIINYMEVHKENFDSSSFLKKNSHLLLVFYLYNKEIDLINYDIKLVGQWLYPEGDLGIIRRDWELIITKIKNGKAHELSEGDTFYLGACTKGSTALKSFREQPFNKKKAKQRAFSLKQGYVNHIIANISKEEKAVYGKILKHPELIDESTTIEDVVLEKFQQFYNKSSEEIEQFLGLNLNKRAKGYFSNLTKAILGIQLDQKIEEFEKADIVVKAVRLKENNLPKENMSFPAFEYKILATTKWEDSDFKNILESKFFIVFYQFRGDELILKKAKFWNMKYSDILEAKQVWKKMKKLISEGKIVKEVTKKGARKTYFPKLTENRISHVRPHAQNSNDTFPLPVADVTTNVNHYTKHSFWLNATYIRDEIYLK
ncbi:MAG TPA: DNA mismatch repair protein [Flavobacteriaceae bacterium]|nr:DNA mismatch repair protein [Flavobacteriaceae bacterium]HIN98054.1 DNA mismatch repair protein [Flavobacteriaceae bacterium]